MQISFSASSYPFFFIILVVDRHTGRIINLEYVGEGEITKTVLLVGKVSKNKYPLSSFVITTTLNIAMMLSV